MEKQIGSVYLVGAGCGTADLITLRGLELLRRCQAVVYDDLIDKALLDVVPVQAERIYMGKRSGRHSARQEEICGELIRQARMGRLVVRLKGGDPYVFGRGGEEFQALTQAGIPCEEVPGISSAIAIPAAAGIPVTHRRLSRGIHIITAHTADTGDALPPEFDHLAKLQGTLVFLMGLRQLPLIVRRLMEVGKNPDTPAAVVSGGNAPNPVAVRGTLGDIAQRAAQAHVAAPAVIVVGSTAELDFSSTISRPLKGIRVGLTGTPAILDKLSPPLRQYGAQVLCLQRHQLVELPAAMEDWTPGSGWIVFTSSNGVRTFFRQLDRMELDRRCLSSARFAVIGGATGKTLREYGYHADLCPEVFTSAALGQALLQTAKPEEPLYLFRSAQATDELPEILRTAGRCVADRRVYDVVPQADTSDGTAVDYLVFASAGGVRAYWETFGEPEAAVRCVCIGEITAKALKARSSRPFLTAPEISAEGIIQAILQDRQL